MVIIPVLKSMAMHSPAAVNLLLGTAAQESHLGQYLVQVKGPALGIYQMEPDTHDDIWRNFLKYRPTLGAIVQQLTFPARGMKNQLIGNLYYATAMARVAYYRHPEKLPNADDIVGLAGYWKNFYNTPLGKGTKEEFIANYRRFVH